jgi:hypothetical protein
MTVVGHGQVRHQLLSRRTQRRLLDLAGGGSPECWGLLFVLDARQHRWVLYSPDAPYTALFAPSAPTLDLDPEIFMTKFPAWNAGWQIP